MYLIYYTKDDKRDWKKSELMESMQDYIIANNITDYDIIDLSNKEYTIRISELKSKLEKIESIIKLWWVRQIFRDRRTLHWK